MEQTKKERKENEVNREERHFNGVWEDSWASERRNRTLEASRHHTEAELGLMDRRQRWMEATMIATKTRNNKT